MSDLFGDHQVDASASGSAAFDAADIPVDEKGRPTLFPMAIQGGMLEALGINMYTTIGKCLVEFVANAHDSDATKVEIDIPYEAIATQRERIRSEAKRKVEEQKADPFTVLLETLPDEIEITITDDGHGMSPEDVYTKFMPLNRKRRVDEHGKETQNLTESGKRHVMGRKGLGKLAGFGAAAEIVITTKRHGDDYSTTFVMDYDLLKNSTNLAKIEIPATYEPHDDLEATGTSIRLRRLKCDAVKQTGNTIEDALATAFYGIEPEDFAIIVNDAPLAVPEVLYEYEYPEDGRDENGFANEVLVLEDGLIKLPFQYVVRFRARERDPDRPEMQIGSLHTDKRGARIYCNRRLAAGPTVKGLPSGMHNFYATEYMECYVKADELDRASIDFVNTNRTELREDNEVVQKLMTRIVEIMRVAVREHGYWREGLVNKKVNDKVKTDRRLNWVATLPKKQREAAKNVLKAIAVTHDVDSDEFQEIAPHMMQAMNASDVLAKLIHLRTDPESITKIARHLEEWQSVERQDVVKHYRARRNAIDGLTKLIEDGVNPAKGTPRNEKELHLLLKNNPWLVRPEFGQFVASDRHLTTTLSLVARHLEIDDFAEPRTEIDQEGDTRPDLVFALGNDPTKPYEIIIVELKSTTIPLTHDHYRQLQDYMWDAKTWLKNEFKDREVIVRGILVGKMPSNESRADGQVRLLRQIEEDKGVSALQVLGLNAMIEHSRVVHVKLIETLADEDDGDEEAEEAIEATERAELEGLPLLAASQAAAE
jgi:Histidine kinase-, DNA gyrase B-, and HSP90-like ATPase.